MGMMVYYKPTDEIFYVEGVRNVITVNDRQTILTVRRGMREKYIKGKMELVNGKYKKVSYFDVVKTSILNNASLARSVVGLTGKPAGGFRRKPFKFPPIIRIN